MKSMLRRWMWVGWCLGSVLLAGLLYAGLTGFDGTGTLTAQAFLPDQTSSGHHQIELACTQCHVEAFGSEELVQDACSGCHAEELERIDDSHPRKKFTDPRNADRLADIDARFCVSCHVEHKPRMTGAMGVTQPDDFCFYCHQDVGDNRPTHANLGFETCGNSGCHNFHDNKALYEDYLVRHMDDPAQLDRQQVEARDLLTAMYLNFDYPRDTYPMTPLAGEDADGPAPHSSAEAIKAEWLASKHAGSGVNCTACHLAAGDAASVAEPDAVADASGSEPQGWHDQPDHTACATCHQMELDGFLQGKHGMRLAAGLSPMTPGQARLPMHEDRLAHDIGCSSCHAAHDVDTRYAAQQACEGCHADEHTLNYGNSAHAALWRDELAGTGAENSGVSCATCHMPRVWREDDDGNERVLVDHNQNNTLRPNDKMLRPVCMQCHGLGFAMDALADPALIRSNFAGQPSVHVESIDMAREVDRLYREKKAARDQQSAN